MSSVFKLIIEDDEGKAIVFPIGSPEVLVGRHEENTIRLMERNVSRRHAKFDRQNGSLFISDLDSYNGVRINGERIVGKQEVHEGDLVQIGDYHLALQKHLLDDSEDLPSDETALSPAPKLGNETLVDAPRPMLSQPTVPMQPRDPEEEDPEAASAVQTSDPAAEPRLDTPTTQVDLEEPTRPIRVAPLRTAEQSRLVCVSTELAGQDYVLVHEEAVIGRVDENEIVVDHRSVSRNHAKIRSDGENFHLTDLESANGILVNGEEFATTQLRNGDLIELGHVFLRFVEGNCPFEPNEEEVGALKDVGIEWLELESNDPDSADTQLSSPAAVEETQRMDAVMEPDSTSEVAETLSRETPLQAETPVDGSALTSTPAETTLTEDGDAPALVTPSVKEESFHQTVGRQPSQSGSFGVEDNTTHETAAGGLYEERSGGGKWFALVVALIAAGAFAIFFQGGSKNEAHDRQLQKLFGDENYKAVVSYFETHKGQFKDEGQAGLLSGKAEERMLAKPETPSDQGLDSDDQDIGDEDDGGEPSALAPDEDLMKRDAARRRRAAAAKRRRAKAKRAQRDRAKQLESQGSRLLLQGEFKQSEGKLKECLKLAVIPDCHRSLGVLYAETGKPAASARHYRAYVGLKPHAKDAERVRALIREYESLNR